MSPPAEGVKQHVSLVSRLERHVDHTKREIVLTSQVGASWEFRSAQIRLRADDARRLALALLDAADEVSR